MLLAILPKSSRDTILFQGKGISKLMFLRICRASSTSYVPTTVCKRERNGQKMFKSSVLVSLRPKIPEEKLLCTNSFQTSLWTLWKPRWRQLFWFVLLSVCMFETCWSARYPKSFEQRTQSSVNCSELSSFIEKWLACNKKKENKDEKLVKKIWVRHKMNGLLKEFESGKRIVFYKWDQKNK